MADHCGALLHKKTTLHLQEHYKIAENALLSLIWDSFNALKEADPASCEQERIVIYANRSGLFYLDPEQFGWNGLRISPLRRHF